MCFAVGLRQVIGLSAPDIGQVSWEAFEGSFETRKRLLKESLGKEGDGQLDAADVAANVAGLVACVRDVGVSARGTMVRLPSASCSC